MMTPLRDHYNAWWRKDGHTSRGPHGWQAEHHANPDPVFAALADEIDARDLRLELTVSGGAPKASHGWKYRSLSLLKVVDAADRRPLITTNIHGSSLHRAAEHTHSRLGGML